MLAPRKFLGVENRTYGEETASPTAPLCSRDQARLALREATDSNAFARATFRLMRTTVPCEFASMTSQWGNLPQCCRWLSSNKATISHEAMLEISATDPRVPIMLSNPGIKVLSTRGIFPPEERIAKMRFYQIFMQPYNWRHAVALFFWTGRSPPALDCVLTIYRTKEQCDFSDVEVATLAALYPEIERARQRIAKLDEHRAAFRSLQHFVKDLPVPIVLLNWQLEILFRNSEGLDYCSKWQNGTRAELMKPATNVPSELLDTCRQLKAEWPEQRARHRLIKMVHKRAVNQSASPQHATISLLQSESSLLANPNFLIVFDGSNIPRHGPLSLVESNSRKRLAGLTARERAVALLAAQGVNNQEIANRFGRSVGTVKAELHAAFKKLCVTNRVQLILRMLEAAPPRSQKAER